MKSGKILALALATAAGLSFSSAQAQTGIEVGMLTCTVIPGTRINLLVRSTADIRCVYTKGGTNEE